MKVKEGQVNVEFCITSTMDRGVIMMEYNLLSVTSHINCIVAHCLINVAYLSACAFIRS